MERITAREARGNSRPVTVEEYDRIAAAGRGMLAARQCNGRAITGLYADWSSIKEKAYSEVQLPWGGATIDAHTGAALETTADCYAITVRPEGVDTVSVPEAASREQFNAAMDDALARFRPTLEYQGGHLGVFHDDDTGRIDIDPVIVVHTLREVEAIGAATRAIGGAYHFLTGDGFWPPHVA